MTDGAGGHGTRVQVPRWPALVTTTMTVVTIGVYVWLIRTQSTSRLVDPVPVVVLTLLVIAVAGETVAAGWAGRRSRTVAAAAVTGVLAGVGVVGIFSVGLLLLLAVPFAGWHASLLVRSTREVSASAAVGIGVAAATAAAGAVLVAPLG